MCLRSNSCWLSASIFFCSVLGGCAFADGLSQRIVRINPQRNDGKPAYTAQECIESDDCRALLTEKIRQAGGDDKDLQASLGLASPISEGEITRFRFVPDGGKTFCKAVLMKISVAPNFGGAAPEVSVSATTQEVLVHVRIPSGEGTPKYAWYDGVVVLLSAPAEANTSAAPAGGCTLGAAPKTASCKGKCETYQF